MFWANSGQFRGKYLNKRDNLWLKMGFPVRAKRQNLELLFSNSHWSKNAWMSKSCVETLLVPKLVDYKEVEPTRETMNSQFYSEVLKHLQKRVNHVQPHIAGMKILRRKNSRPHTALVATEYLAEVEIRVLPHPSDSSDMVTCEFLLFTA